MPGVATSGIQFEEPPIFERGAEERSAVSIDPLDVPPVDARAHFGSIHRDVAAELPEVSEPEVVRHYVRLSQWNFSIDTQFFPLGSCTMKHNPKVNEWAARLPGFANMHPLSPPHLSQGCLEIMVRLQEILGEIVGLPGVSLQPAAGAQGEFTGLMMMRAYHQSQGRSPRKILIPDSAHGTNPASCALNGFIAVPFPTSESGLVDPETFARVVEKEGDDVAGLMATNPNTLGMYESAMPTLARLVHERGGLVYGDGANMNAVLGKARPGDAGVDVMQFNLHKTFTTPHGGGGPGSGPVAFVDKLAPFQPGPVPRREGEAFVLDYDRPQSIGRVRSFQGNFGMFVRAYTYIRELGPEGLSQVSERAVLNSNYLAARVKEVLPLGFETPSLHEAVFTDKVLEQKTGIKTLDVAKRLIDYGFHPPTVYFPLVVRGALMIEPTETETRQTIDAFVSALKEIAREAEETPELVRSAPHLSKVRRLDEARAARKPSLRWYKPGTAPQ
jgi:glycine dehydrogenase subunit 2